MGYSIHYGPGPKIERQRKKRSYIIPVAAMLLMISIFTAKYIWPEKASRLQETLFPWTQEAVEEAFATFVENMHNGESFHYAATAFCLEILQDAQLP